MTETALKHFSQYGEHRKKAMKQFKKEGNASLSYEQWSNPKLTRMKSGYFIKGICPLTLTLLVRNSLLNIPFGYSVLKWFNLDPKVDENQSHFHKHRLYVKSEAQNSTARQEAWCDRHDTSIPQLFKTQLFAVHCATLCSDNIST